MSVRSEMYVIFFSVLIFAWYFYLLKHFLGASFQAIEEKTVKRPNKNASDPERAVKRYQDRACEAYDIVLSRNSIRPFLEGLVLLVAALPIHAFLLLVVNALEGGQVFESQDVSWFGILYYLAFSFVDEVSLGFFEFYLTDLNWPETIGISEEANKLGLFTIILSRFVLVSIGLEKLVEFLTRITRQIRGDIVSAIELRRICRAEVAEIVAELRSKGWFEG